ncbi:putative zinc finger MYM-type protein 1-like [Apostichopus japonicus]|uniref:Putative zinc finger MYM-type protein 1-like n=1 Tax=Stichopus japonicus TaxID=307972 RepID=A0A2G8JAR1_STIJA|nr:putative zinc finger MYM-type protein 1-like [Apostichopus japonicus]
MRKIATEESTNAKASSQHMGPSDGPIDIMTGIPRRRNLPDSPYHPEDTSCIPPKVAKQQFHFQAKWFSMYSWLHYDHEKEGVLCFSCHDAYQKGLAFITTGFQNFSKSHGTWQEGTGRFQQHQLSSTHNFALSQLKAQEAKTVRALIDSLILQNSKKSTEEILSVDDELNVREDFIGLYEMASSTGEAISIMILDVIARLGLSVEKLRASTEGAKLR